MRTPSLIALAATAAALLSVSQPVSAFDALHRPDLRYRQFDPDKAADLERYYGYYYSPRGWYPYYNSGEWGPRQVRRYRGHLPPYYASWGSPKRNYRHVEWHRRHYGGHRRGDW
ncbi:hypothetical protein DLM45_14455 [Hyphomicrobium methylovorum]|uniref:hypothetical protein n=1 Tax=Hyphomicrobium methylovorum TaxID=84 RepID=UPI0015E69A4B|nr:hypothetical protein [Hyphomicrobium methylovorum]MBA2127413.1 hypothetical protein [Hyphomicrobium methylovorum]